MPYFSLLHLHFEAKTGALEDASHPGLLRTAILLFAPEITPMFTFGFYDPR